MKKWLFILVLISSFVTALSAQENIVKKNDPVGLWKFEASTAPSGYTSGTISVGFTDQKNTVSISFAGSDYKIPGEKVTVADGNIIFTVYLEGENIKVSLKIENETRMSGKAVYSAGEVPLTLTRSVDEPKS